MNILSNRSKGVTKSDYTLKSRPIGDLAQDRVLPRQLSTGTLRGQLTIVGDNGEKIVLGQVPGSETETAITFLDGDDNIVSKTTAQTDYVYNPTTGDVVFQSKRQPDGTYGVSGANEGFDVSEGFE